MDLVRSLGADDVVDYATTDFVGMGRRYDLILDTVGNRTATDLRRVLADGGKAAVTGFSNMRNLMSTSLRGGKDVTQVKAQVATDDLNHLSGLLDAGKVRPVVDRTFGFSDVPRAIAYVEDGHARGKVVVHLS